MACAICQIRREKRHCPGIQGEICAICCGEQREETIDCPLSCEFLILAHQHEAVEQRDMSKAPNADYPVPREFVDKNYEMVMIFEHAIAQAALEKNAIDYDVREALDHLARTYQTLGSGLYYESRPQNPIAGAILDGVQARVAELRKIENERGMHKLTDRGVLTILVFLQHLEYTLNNGRKRGRAFIHFMLGTVVGASEHMGPDPGSLIVS